MADRSSLRNFLSFASAVAKSVALAALSFSTCDFVRLNTRNPFIAFSSGTSYQSGETFRLSGSGSSVSRDANQRKVGPFRAGDPRVLRVLDGRFGSESLDDDRQLLQPERRCLLRDTQSRRQGVTRDHDRGEILQSVHALRPAHSACGTRALRLVPSVQARRVDLGLARQLRAAISGEVSRALPRDVEARLGPTWPRAQVPPTPGLTVRTGRGKGARPATGAAAKRGTC